MRNFNPALNSGEDNQESSSFRTSQDIQAQILRVSQEASRFCDAVLEDGSGTLEVEEWEE
jgi:hypothetical protein